MYRDRNEFEENTNKGNGLWYLKHFIVGFNKHLRIKGEVQRALINIKYL